MNGLVLAVFLSVVGLSAGAGTQLICYSKGYFSVDMKSTVTCAAGEQCASSVAYRDGISAKLYSKRCLPEAQCNGIQNDAIGEISYKVNNTCCNTNVCNAAQSLRMTAWAGMGTLMLFILMFV